MNHIFKSSFIRSLVNFSSHRCCSVRVRFAPSPTGDLHLGGLRTALYNYAFTKKSGGSFIIRCEDTDQTRKVDSSLESLMELLEWIGLEADESPKKGGPYGSYIQSERLDVYQKWVQYLLDNGSAYKCFCSTQRLELLRKEQIKNREIYQGYDNRCRDLTQEQIDEFTEQNKQYTIRLRMKDVEPSLDDMVYGHIKFQTKIQGDPVILKSDGYPTYHLANVVDDHLMKITHVLRGAEWLSSTPKHLVLYEAFGWKPPRFAHLPLLMNPDGTKLSKRQKDLSVKYLKHSGYLPNSILSLLCLWGGAHDSLTYNYIHDNGATLEEAVKHFSLSSMRTQNAILHLEELKALNRAGLLKIYQSEDRETFMKKLEQVAKHELQVVSLSEFQNFMLNRIYDKYNMFIERIGSHRDLFHGELHYIMNIADSNTVVNELSAVCNINDVINVLNLVLQSDLKQEAGDLLAQLQKSTGMKTPVLWKIMRIAITGNSVGVPVKELLQVFTEETFKQRIKTALHSLQLKSAEL